MPRRSPASELTADHETIRRWAVERGGSPARALGSGAETDSSVLRIDFPGFGGEEPLEAISWEEFFDGLDHGGLALELAQDVRSRRSRHHRFVRRATSCREDAP